MNDYRSITAVFRDGRKRTYRSGTRPRQFYRCAEDYAIESGKAGAEQYCCVDCNIIGADLRSYCVGVYGGCPAARHSRSFAD